MASRGLPRGLDGPARLAGAGRMPRLRKRSAGTRVGRTIRPATRRTSTRSKPSGRRRRSGPRGQRRRPVFRVRRAARQRAPERKQDERPRRPPYGLRWQSAIADGGRHRRPGRRRLSLDGKGWQLAGPPARPYYGNVLALGFAGGGFPATSIWALESASRAARLDANGLRGVPSPMRPAREVPRIGLLPRSAMGTACRQARRARPRAGSPGVGPFTGIGALKRCISARN